MKVLYIVDFPVDGNSGKNKATREKAAALKSILGDDNLEFIHPVAAVSFFKKLLNRFLLDFRVSSKTLSTSGKVVVVQRVFLMPFSRVLFFLKGIKVISEFHADFKEEITYLDKSPIQKKILHLISPLFNFNYRISDGIIFNHPILKDKFDKVFKKPSIYSYNGSNPDEYYLIPKDHARATLAIPSERIIFLFLGSVSKWHGVDLLIEVFNQEVIRTNPLVYLYIVGAKENETVADLKKIALNTNIIFHQPVGREKASQFINSADYCMLPVKNIRTSPGSPLKLYDYIACGQAVITQQDLAGYSDEVERYGLGYTTDFNSPKRAAKDLLKIMENSAVDFSENNREVAITKVSWESRMQKWLQFINEIVEDKK